jgi:WhiB family transcriptional regulator, redox-sensing transcriptional regulator
VGNFITGKSTSFQYGRLAFVAMASPKTWRRYASCIGQDRLFFDPNRTREAKAICAACPVSSDCYRDALTHNSYHGVWGGRSEKDLIALPDQIGRGVRIVIEHYP